MTCPHCGQPDPYIELQFEKIYEGSVTGIFAAGAEVTLRSGFKGFVHISQIAHNRTKSVADNLSIGDQVKMKVTEVDDHGNIRFSIKAVQ